MLKKDPKLKNKEKDDGIQEDIHEELNELREEVKNIKETVNRLIEFVNG